MDIVPKFNISVDDTPHTHTHTKTRNLGIHMGISHSNGQFLFQTQRKAMPKSVKLPHNCTVAVISQASKVMLKILQAGLQQYVNCELPDV